MNSSAPILWAWLLWTTRYKGLASDYFVRPGGNDALTGRTQREAWRSIERVNRHFAG